MTSKQAADLLEVSPRRVLQLIKQGTLEAARFGNAALLDSAKVREYAHTRLPAPHRSLTPQAAWDLIKSQELSWMTDKSHRDLTRRRLRARANFVRGYAHRSITPQLAISPLAAWSGQGAAEAYAVPVDSRDAPLIGYVNEPDFNKLPFVEWRPVSSPRPWNVEIGLIPKDVPWPFKSEMNFVDPITCWLDLEDHQDRAARLAFEQLPSILRASQSEN